MRLPTRYTQRTPLKFNITPLIDVVFLLIIFFLVASHFVRSEQSEPVELPLAMGGQTDTAQAANRLTITLTQDGSIFINGKRESVDVAKERIAQLATDEDSPPEVRFRGHRSGQFGHVRELIEHCAAVNVRAIRFAVDKPGESR